MVPYGSAFSATPKSVEEILAEFQEKSFDLARLSDGDIAPLTAQTTEDFDSIRQETVAKLVSLGYTAYEVTDDTYDSVENILNTDLSSMGMQRDSSYIVVLGRSSSEKSRSGKAYDDSYSYTYGGETYKLRDVTVTSADSPNYSQISTVDLLESNTDTFIENMLNAAVSAYATALGVPAIFGTIGSITGLTTIHFSSSKRSSAIFNAGSSWTREFTQAWNSDFETWEQGSYVEYVRKACVISGMRYDSTVNRCVPYDSNEESDISYSKNYHDETWRKDNAVIALRGGLPVIRDSVGDIYYEYDSDVIVKHRGNFI